MENERERNGTYFYIKRTAVRIVADFHWIATPVARKKIFPAKESSLSERGIGLYIDNDCFAYIRVCLPGIPSGTDRIGERNVTSVTEASLDDFSTALSLILSRESASCSSLHHEDPFEIVELDQRSPHLYAMNYKHGRHTRCFIIAPKPSPIQRLLADWLGTPFDKNRPSESDTSRFESSQRRVVRYGTSVRRRVHSKQKMVVLIITQTPCGSLNCENKVRPLRLISSSPHRKRISIKDNDEVGFNVGFNETLEKNCNT